MRKICHSVNLFLKHSPKLSRYATVLFILRHLSFGIDLVSQVYAQGKLNDSFEAEKIFFEWIIESKWTKKSNESFGNDYDPVYVFFVCFYQFNTCQWLEPYAGDFCTCTIKRNWTALSAWFHINFPKAFCIISLHWLLIFGFQCHSNFDSLESDMITIQIHFLTPSYRIGSQQTCCQSFIEVFHSRFISSTICGFTICIKKKIDSIKRSSQAARTQKNRFVDINDHNAMPSSHPSHELNSK